MNTEKLITFCVPCYNSAEYMATCVNSLLEKKDQGIEIIIIDDGSKDKTGEIADKFASENPEVVLALHQENGGHGEGINNALKHATGLYFKVVDSDDWVDQDGYQKLLDAIKKSPEVDLFITNYVYCVNKVPTKVIDFKDVFREDTVLDWKDVKSFKYWENLTLHSATYRTQVLKDSGVILPRKVFYEDNYLIYAPLRLVKKLYYINANFYCYFIGRDGQSVAREACIRKYKDHIKIAELMVNEYNVFDYKKEKKQFKTMRHHLKLVVAIALLYTRLNKTKEAKQDYKNYIKYIKETNKKVYYWLHYRSYCFLFMIPGWLGGRLIVRFFIWLAHIFVPFY